MLKLKKKNDATKKIRHKNWFSSQLNNNMLPVVHAGMKEAEL